MNKINKIRTLAAAMVIALVFSGCDKQLDEAPYITFDGEANMTIAELLALHTCGASDSYDSIPAGTVICGIITSSDEEGNCYKVLNIQDETGGIQIKIDDSSLHPKYQIGQRVYVKCGDLVIGDYRKNRQLGFWMDGAMSGLASSQEDLYIFRDSLVGPEPQPIVITSASQLNESMVNCLVRIENCSFRDGGSKNYCDPDANTSRDLLMADNSEIVVRTSSYAKFANTLLPAGTGSVCGILTVYNSTYQLTMRSASDARMTSTTTTELASVDFSSNPLETQGWTVGNTAGTLQWRYYASNGGLFGIQNTAADECESWLISPAYNFGGGEVSLSLEQTIRENDIDQYKIFCTTNYNGDISAAQWTEIPAYGTLPQEMTANHNFRIAFRYSDNAGGSWKISGIRFLATTTTINK